MPRITVITGYHNREGVVARTLKSIQDQTFRDFEFIVFDDASTDGTLSAITHFASRANDPRVKIRAHESNTGFVRGLREAIEASDSEYIAIQGSGDVSLPLRLEKQVSLLDRRPEVGAVGCWYYNVIETEGVRRLRQPDANATDQAALIHGRNVFSHGEVMIRRSAYEASGGYRDAFKNSQDIDLWLRLVEVSRLATVPETLYERYVQFDGVSYSPRKFPTQMKYSLAARALATMSAVESATWVEKIEQDGPGCLIADDNPRLQKLFLQSTLRSAVWGAGDDALEIAANLRPQSRRRAVEAALRIFGSRPAAPVRALTRKALGVAR